MSQSLDFFCTPEWKLFRQACHGHRELLLKGGVIKAVDYEMSKQQVIQAKKACVALQNRHPDPGQFESCWPRA